MQYLLQSVLEVPMNMLTKYFVSNEGTFIFDINNRVIDLPLDMRSRFGLI